MIYSRYCLRVIDPPRCKWSTSLPCVHVSLIRSRLIINKQVTMIYRDLPLNNKKDRVSHTDAPLFVSKSQYHGIRVGPRRGGNQTVLHRFMEMRCTRDTNNARYPDCMKILDKAIDGALSRVYRRNRAGGTSGLYPTMPRSSVDLCHRKERD